MRTQADRMKGDPFKGWNSSIFGCRHFSPDGKMHVLVKGQNCFRIIVRDSDLTLSGFIECDDLQPLWKIFRGTVRRSYRAIPIRRKA